MNNNEESLIKHALKLYGMQYNDNIKLRYSNYKFIEVSDRNIQYGFILNLYDGTDDESIYESRNTPSKLNDNIRSFINHWIQYYNVNEDISHVAIRKCSHNSFDIAILYDNSWYRVLLNPYIPVDDWIMYNW